MALSYPDKIEHNNPSLPLVDDNQLGGGFRIVADKTARNAIPAGKRKINGLVAWTEGTSNKLMKYIGPDLLDASWQNDANWAAIGNSADVYFSYPFDDIIAYDTGELGMCLYSNFFANSDIVPAAYYYKGTRERIYFRFFEGLKDGANATRTGFYSRNWITYYDLKEKAFGQRYVMPCDYPSSTDYHNQGAMLVADDGHIIYIQEKLNSPGGHNSPLEIYRSNSEEDISIMNLVVTITGEFTYPMLRKLTNGDLYIIVRERVGGQERYMKILKSTDNGLTWAGLTGTANTFTTIIDLNLSGWFLYKYNVYSQDSEGLNLAVVAHQGVGSYGRRLYFLHSADGRNWTNAREYISPGNGYTRDVVTDGVLTDALLQTNYFVDGIAEGSSTAGLGSRWGGLNSLDKIPILTYWVYNPSIQCADIITAWYITKYDYATDTWIKKDIQSILSSGRNFANEYLSNYYNHIYSYGNGVIDLFVPNIKKDNNIIDSLPIISSGTLVGGVYYRIITTEANHFGTGVVVGNIKRSAGTETCDANNTVRPVKLGVTIFRSVDYGQSWTLLVETDKTIIESAQGVVGMLDNIYDNPDASCFFFGIMRSKAAAVIEYCDLGLLFGKRIAPDVLTTIVTSAPSVTTDDVTGIADTSATGNGNVTDDGNLSVTARGTCWSTSHNPTTADSHTTDGTGEGVFTSSLTPLIAETLYYVRAYATNSIGTSYGAEKSFTTSAAIVGSVYGYIAGGKTGTNYEASAERITFSTGAYAANTTSNLSQARGFISGVSDSTTYGYFCGGHTGGHTATTDRITFSTGATAANTASNLSGKRSYTTGVSDGATYGYVCGGYSGANIATTDRITFSTSATAANTASNLSTARRNCAGISDNASYGYVIAGYISAATDIADRITFSTGATAANTSSNASQARHAICGISDQATYGYVFGGATVGSGTEVVTADRITFSTGATAANTSSNLSLGRAYISGLGDGNLYGYISGGATNATPVNVNTTDRITFSTGATAANTTSNLTAVRQGHGGMSDKSV